MEQERLPPGSAMIESLVGSHVVLSPQPSSDPNEPLNWSTKRKTLHMTLLFLYGLLITSILCAAQPLWQLWNAELGFSYTTLNNAYAATTAALAVACIFFIPMALRFGRRPVYLFTGLLMLCSSIWQSVMKRESDLFGYSILTGFASAINEALFQVSISDLFYVHQRGTMNGIFLISFFIGVYLSPRWAFWYLTIFTGTLLLCIVFAFEETKYVAPILNGMGITRRASIGDGELTGNESKTKLPLDLRQTKDTLDQQYLTRFVEIDLSIPLKSYWQRHSIWNSETYRTTSKRSIGKHFYMPFLFLVQFPAVLFVSMVYGYFNAVMSIVTIIQTTLYPLPPYNFTTVGVGNMNIAPAIGLILGTIYGGPLVDWSILQIAKRRKGIYEPEHRLWLFVFPSLVMIAGLLLFGLTIAKGMAWQINAVGAALVGFGLGGCGDITLTYLQDSYTLILGDALIGVVFIRNAISTTLVFAISPWIEGMGVYNMFVLLGCLTVVTTLACVLFIVKGRDWRVKFAGRYEHYRAQQFS
ncbi:serine/threonine kinase 16 [Cadophora sp. DSE1049]|nr:serine/threonine kinase 16 [Cadophora sp. DSE1049]